MSRPVIFGVCAWLGSRFGINVKTLRIIFVVATVIGIGSPILVYLVLALVKPKHY